MVFALFCGEKETEMSLEFRIEVYAEKINFGFLNLCIMFKVMKLSTIVEKMIVGRKGMKTKDRILQCVNIKYPELNNCTVVEDLRVRNHDECNLHSND